jgi:hypothetical protein
VPCSNGSCEWRLYAKSEYVQRVIFTFVRQKRFYPNFDRNFEQTFSDGGLRDLTDEIWALRWPWRATRVRRF